MAATLCRRLHQRRRRQLPKTDDEVKDEVKLFMTTRRAQIQLLLRISWCFGADERQV